MSTTIQFSNGRRIKFSSKPSIEDIEEASKTLDINSGKKDLKKEFTEHPFKSTVKAIFSPAAETLTGTSLQERALQSTAPKEIEPGNTLAYAKAFAKQAGSGMAGSVADIATTPASFIPFPLGKLIGKIPIKGSSLGAIAGTVPLGKLLTKQAPEIAAVQTALKNLPARVALSRAPLIKGKASTEAVNTVKNALNSASKIRTQQEAVNALERSTRAKGLSRIQFQGKGKKGFVKELSFLKEAGEFDKVEFEAIKNLVSPADMDELFNMVKFNRFLGPHERLAAQEGLDNLFNGKLPIKSQLELLSEVFPKDFIQAILNKRTLFKKAQEFGFEILNIPRAMMTSFDMSAPLRQGAFLIGRPKQFLPAFGRMFKYFGSEKAYQNSIKEIKSRVTYPMMKEGKLALTDMVTGLAGREEAFMSRFAEKIPIFGPVVKASNRAFAGFLNKLRADVFDDLVSSASRQGVKVNRKVLRNIGEFVGAATGRGKLPNSLEKSAVALNSVFFSPRLLSSRLTLMDPRFYTKLDPFTRKEALKSLFTFAGTAGTIMSLSAMGGAKIGSDPRSADFGKIKRGNTRFDILGGFQQYIRMAAQFITGETISTTTGVKSVVGEGFKPLTRAEIISRFFQSKTAPTTSFVINALKGRGSFGQEFNLTEEVANRFIPMVIQDGADLAREGGFDELGMITPAIFGVGVQTYSPSPSGIVYAARSVKKSARDLHKQGRHKEAEKLKDDNKDILVLGEVLRKAQTKLNSLKRSIREIRKNIDLPNEVKEIKIKELDRLVENLEQKMEEVKQRHYRPQQEQL